VVSNGSSRRLPHTPAYALIRYACSLQENASGLERQLAQAHVRQEGAVSVAQEQSENLCELYAERVELQVACVAYAGV
jgi:hypothetical protein